MFDIPRPVKENALPIFIIVIVVLIGYYRLFFGYNFYLYADQLFNSNLTYGNSLGNGWRPEKGFGLSHFYADPGAWHAWSILSLWERISSSKAAAYSTSVVVLGIFSAIAVFFLLRRIVPGLGTIASCLISPLIIFTMSQNSFQYNRIPISGIVGISLLLIILYDFYKQPSLIHLFYITLVFWYVMFTGAYLIFAVLPSVGFVFTIIYFIYYKDSREKIFSKYVLIFLIGGICTILLGFWEFYSIFVESKMIEYMREKIYEFPMGIIPDIKIIAQGIVSFIHFYSIPTNINFIGLGWRPFFYSWNVTVIFPLIFIFFLCRRSTSFWEFVLKWLIGIFYISQILLSVPAFDSINGLLATKTNLLFNFYGVSWVMFIFPLQIGLIGVYLSKVAQNDFKIEHLWGRKIQLVIAWMLFIFYAGLTIFGFLSIFKPDFLPAVLVSVSEHFVPEQIGKFSKEYLVYGTVCNFQILQNSMHWYSLMFYLLSAVLVFIFIRHRWLSLFAGNRVKFLAGILLAMGIFQSWTVYPLNKKQPVWNEISHELPEFNPTDRFYYVKPKLINQQYIWTADKLRELKGKVDAAGGPLEYLKPRAGFEESPCLMFHGGKSFDQKDVAEFTYHIFNGDGTQRLESVRQLYFGGPVIFSELLDMGAVSYYYSNQALPAIPRQLSLYAKTKRIYIYKNHAAWPYFYLAEKMDIKEDGKHLKNVRRGTAYVSEKDYFKLSGNLKNSKLKLKEFKYGKMVFDYQADKKNFLVVADAWHPFWKAKTETQNFPVVKANEIFKGVRLPAGKYIFTLFFDTSPYFPGIYVSIIAWVLFILGWILVLRFKWELPQFIK